MKTSVKLLLCVMTIGFAWLANAYEVEYQVELVPDEAKARVKLLIDNVQDDKKRVVKDLSFNYKPDIQSNFKANGKLKVSGNSVSWRPPLGKAWLSLDVKLIKARGDGEYDSFINSDWALFRGDDLLPPASVRTLKNAKANTQLEFTLPKNWKNVNTGWERDKTPGRKDRMGFFVDDPERNFDRPTGWMIAGDIATRRDLLGETVVSVTGPKRASFKEGVILERMEILTFLNFVWPQYQKLLPEQPQKLLIVGAGEPMWRGGLSGPNNLFIHADRPVVSENGTSTLLHEVFHALTRIRGAKNDDWIAEGLAEYYSIMLMYRSGGMTNERLELVFQKLQARSKKVTKLRKLNSTGATTAKAALIFSALDEEIKSVSKGQYSLNDVVRQLVVKREVSLDDLREVCKSLIEQAPKALVNLK